MEPPRGGAPAIPRTRTNRADYNCNRMTETHWATFFAVGAMAMGGSVYDFSMKAIDGKAAPDF